MIFYQHSESGRVTTLVVYVDNIIFTGSDLEERAVLEKQLICKSDMKNPGQMKLFLGIQVVHSFNRNMLSQQRYMFDLLKDTGFTDHQPSLSPMEVNHRLTLNEHSVDIARYQSLIGRLIYLVRTRPNIS